MKCKNCGNDLRNEWKFCPNCGNKIIRLSKVFNIEKVFEEFSKMFMPISGRMGGPGRIKVRIINKSPSTGTRVVHKKQAGLPQKNFEVVEPATSITEKGSFKIISLELPGVKKEENVYFNRVGKSLEINAYSGKKRYFKIINLEDLEIINKELVDEKLVLKLK